jgi:hypothetical protein
MIFSMIVCLVNHYKFVQQVTWMFKFNIHFSSFCHNWIFHYEITYFEQIIHVNMSIEP